jgi:predicted nucleic acid-binding protein
MRVMLDTNVLISAVIFPNDRMNTLIYKAALSHQLVLSSYIIDELLEVTERKFPAKVKDIEKPEIITPAEFLERY